MILAWVSRLRLGGPKTVNPITFIFKFIENRAILFRNIIL
jgi:hypothetical protein